MRTICQATNDHSTKKKLKHASQNNAEYVCLTICSAPMQETQKKYDSSSNNNTPNSSKDQTNITKILDEPNMRKQHEKIANKMNRMKSSIRRFVVAVAVVVWCVHRSFFSFAFYFFLFISIEDVRFAGPSM